MSDVEILHGTCVKVGANAVLLVGPSGSGKSDLALRLIDRPGLTTGADDMGCMLVADDQVVVRRVSDHLLASAPEALAGLIEVRGLGIMSVPALSEAKIVLVLDLAASAGIERLLDLKNSRRNILGILLPVLPFDPFTLSAPARVRIALHNIEQLFSR